MITLGKKSIAQLLKHYLQFFSVFYFFFVAKIMGNLKKEKRHFI